MIKRIIFLVENQFTFRDYQRFGIELLQENNFRVDIWDLSHILNPELCQNYAPMDVCNYIGLYVCEDRMHLQQKLRALSSDDFIINLVGYRFENFDVYKTLSRSNAHYAVFYANALPIPEPTEYSFFSFLKNKIKSVYAFRYMETWKRFYTRLPLRWIGVKPARMIIAGGEKCFNYYYPVDKNTEVLHVHSLDYDFYLKERDIKRQEQPIAVFVDEFLPFHPDYLIFKRKPPVHAERYYALLNIFFDYIEKETGFNVVIAAHPRSDYERRADCFKGRTCIKGKTIELIRESRLVLAHSSTSLSFANLFFKPVLFMTFSELNGTCEEAMINEMAKWFAKYPIYIDNDLDINLTEEMKVDRKKYESYRKSYIKAEHGEDLLCWQIIANRLKKGFYN